MAESGQHAESVARRYAVLRPHLDERQRRCCWAARRLSWVDTSARAVLHADSPGHPAGLGHARRSPTDVTVPEIGDEVATARALHALADAVLDAAAHDIEAIEHRAVHLTFEGATQSRGRRHLAHPGGDRPHAAVTR